MKLPGSQLVLDTNVLMHWLRGRREAEALRAEYELGGRKPRPVIPVVVKGEIMSLALQRSWGEDKTDKLEAMFRDWPVADISADAVIDAYARIDKARISAGQRMAKNDLWIAAVTASLGGILLTADADFDGLDPDFLTLERIHLLGPGR